MKIGLGFFIALVVVAIAYIVPAVCMWLWNWLMPDLFGVKNIDYWQALGLMVLSTCFFYRGGGSSKK